MGSGCARREPSDNGTQLLNSGLVARAGARWKQDGLAPWRSSRAISLRPEMTLRRFDKRDLGGRTSLSCVRDVF